jgi:CCR4-NOT transcriptional regulation complex NOT5 subunit
MAVLTIRSVKGEPLTNTEVDDNFLNLNADVITNASDISTLNTNVSTNASDISTLNTNVSTSASDISTNASDISTNASNISLNNSDIGILTNLSTTAKADLVVAINEVNAAMTANNNLINSKADAIAMAIALGG